MSLIKTLKERYSAKVYQKGHSIPPQIIEELLESLHLSPSSLNLQPWHFFVAHDDQSRQRIAKSATGSYGFNHERITHASHVIVLCARRRLTHPYLEKLLNSEERDGRITSKESRDKALNARSAFLSLHKSDHDVTSWNAKQVYLAAGFLLLSAGLLKIDATPIEGFDKEILTNELELDNKNLTPCLIVSLGYHDQTDRNKTQAKSRLDKKDVFTWL